MRKLVVPLCVAVAALAAACTSTSSGTGVEVGVASTSPTATGTVPSMPSGSTDPPTPTAIPTQTHSLGPQETSASPSKSPRPTPTKKPKPHPSGPAAVVTTYVSAINRHDYRTAWTIYRHAAHGQSYSQFVAGFSGTDHDQLKILGTSGSSVQVDLVAYQTDGSKHHFTGTYTVSNGRITASHISAAS
jgi:cell division septation protein DedD